MSPLARRLERHSAYDGACWTLDGHLIRNAARLDLPVQLAAS